MDDLVALLEELGVTITVVTPARVYGFCPMHEVIKGRPDSDPSWSIDQDLLVHHCWSCSYRGTLRGLVADVQETDQRQAGEWLRGFDALWLKKRLQKSARPTGTPTAKLEPENALQSLLKGFGDPPADVMERRQLAPFAVAHFGVRWDPENRGWITPIRRENGELLGYQFKRRHLVRNHPKKMRKRETLFGIDVFPEGGRAVLVESPLDVVRLYSEGIAGGLAAFGAEVSAEQLELLVDRADELVLALDNDEAGQLARNLLIQRLWYSPLRVWVLDYTDSEAKDVGEMSGDEIRSRLAAPLWKFDVAVADNVFHL
jgi:hypothetical protein